MRKVLTIAGSDSGGGAGIQADLKTFAAYNVHGLTVVTAVTAQNTIGVTAIQNIEPAIIKAQMEAVISDIGVDAVKIGMLHSAEIIETVSDMIVVYELVKVVVDPVMIATSGAELLEPEAKEALVNRLLPLAKIVTPNIHEAEILSGIKIKSIDDAKRAAEIISRFGSGAVLVKGGHLDVEGKAVDILYCDGIYTIYTAPFYDTRNTHGTGCCLSSAIAAELASGKNIIDAVQSAKDFVNKSIKNGLDIGKGPGPVNPMAKLYDEAEKISVLENVREAVKMIEAYPQMSSLVAECQMNIGMALSYASSPMDVAAVDGRLTKHMGCVRAAGSPRFGASLHIANTILAAREHKPQLRAALNLAYTEKTVEAMKAMGLLVSYYDRREEPEELKEIEGMTTRWGSGEALKRIDGTPDAIYHLGDWGKESMIVLLGETAIQVAEKAVKIAEYLGA
jgi:hydroxymethylpyrimidine/phosphomethylpyrimidine kinase